MRVMKEEPSVSADPDYTLSAPESERGPARYIFFALMVALGAVVTAAFVNGDIRIDQLKSAVRFVRPEIVAGVPHSITLCLGFLLIGLFLLLFTEKQTSGKLAVVMGTALLFVLSTAAFSDMLLARLERRYPRLILPSDSKTNRDARASKFIVVLTDPRADDLLGRISGRSHEDGLACLVEAIRLHRRLAGRKVVIVGSRSHDSSARQLAVVAEGLGVSPRNILVELRAEDALEQARDVGEIVGNTPFILVAPASRMPRVMTLFTEMGLNPVPAPAAHASVHRSALEAGDLYPSSQELSKTEKAIQDYLGLAWAKLAVQTPKDATPQTTSLRP